MTDERFELWNGQVWAAYRTELIQSGMTEDAADENVSHNIAASMPDGVLTEGNFVFTVRKDEQSVGVVWLSDRQSEWFIYDIEIAEELRGQGLGRATMRCIEEYVRSKGGTAIGLSVFGFNKRAQNLYLSEGYEIVRLAMSKKLDE